MIQAGAAQFKAGLLSWLQDRPQPSIEKLRRINISATHSGHVILALSYGLTDRHIGAINKLIIGLLIERLKAKRQGSEEKEAQVEKKLQAVHEAIDQVTGTALERYRNSRGKACNKVSKSKLAPS